MKKFHGTIEIIDSFLKKHQLSGSWSESQLNHRFQTTDGAVLLWYKNGTVQTQGRGKSKEIIDSKINELWEPIPQVEVVHAPVEIKAEQTLFVVYGHDRSSRDQLELILRKIDIEPFILGSTSGEGLTIIESLEKRIGQNGNATAAVILLTPDDIGYANSAGPERARSRARQNVILEMGMVLGQLGRQKTILIKKGDLEVPSDADGIIYLSFQNHVSEIVPVLVERLEQCGFKIDHKKAIAAAK